MYTHFYNPTSDNSNKKYKLSNLEFEVASFPAE
jgi:hypothetical protein